MSMELVSIREAARRMGLSDTAVRKAIKDGRVILDPSSLPGKPLLPWPTVRDQWGANSDAGKRTHAGAQSNAPRRANDSPVFLPVAADLQGDLQDDGGDLVIHDGMSLNEAKTVSAIYAARKAKAEWEELQRTLVRSDKVESSVFRLARAARDEMQTMEDRLSPILASESDISEVRKILRDETRRICERIAKAGSELLQ